MLKYSVGAINIDECRVGNEEHSVNINDFSNQHGNQFGNGKPIAKMGEKVVIGRFPANTILTYDDSDFDEVCGGFPNTKSKMAVGIHRQGRSETQVFNADNCGLNNKNFNPESIEGYNDSGSAARYFYCAKASKKDRDEGLELFQDKFIAASNQAKAELKRGNTDFEQKNSVTWSGIQVRKNIHPTVKPTTLMQYLIRLVTPNGETVLDPFNGSGSTGKAVMYENKDHNKGYKYIGVELSEEYLNISKARIEFIEQHDEEPENNDDAIQMSIFDYLGGAK